MFFQGPFQATALLLLNASPLFFDKWSVKQQPGEGAVIMQPVGAV